MDRKKTNNRKPDVILTSDWHLREDTPACRTDDFWNAQWGKVEQVRELADKYGCPVLHAGDLFHHWKPSPRLLSECMIWLPDQFFTVYGQHDIPQHNMELNYKSGIYTLLMAQRLEVMHGNWGEDLKESWPFFTDVKVAVWHKFVWDGKKVPWPGCDEMTAEEVLNTYPEYDLIVTGDHHKSFTHEVDGRLLVNPGCLTRQAADYADHRPCVYLWYAEDNAAEPYYLDVAEGVVSREHIEQQQKRDRRIEAFVERITAEGWEVSVSFEENLARFLTTNQMRKGIHELIYKAIEK